MLGSVASGTTRVTGLASSADCRATLNCIRNLGITVDENQSEIVIHGQGLFGYRSERSPVDLDAGNSGSTIRMLSGLLAGQRVISRIDGDQSLRRRPMRRIIKPLQLMGAEIEAIGDGFAPLTIRGAELNGIRYDSPVASAQVKSCVLLAGLLARGKTTVSEPAQSRDHTEIMLREMDARIEVQPGVVSVEGLNELKPLDYRVPGDVSSAAFFIAAASILPGSELTITNVNLNPTRTAFIEVLRSLGATIEIGNITSAHGELIGDIGASYAQLKSRPGTVFSGSLIPNLIDEIPILAVVATQIDGRVEVREAKELRIKESDRIRTVADGIRSLGGRIEEFEDGFAIEGPQELRGGLVESAGDHRLAMAMSVAGLAARGTTEVRDADCAAVSFPEFYDLLKLLAGPQSLEFVSGDGR